MKKYIFIFGLIVLFLCSAINAQEKSTMPGKAKKTEPAVEQPKETAKEKIPAKKEIVKPKPTKKANFTGTVVSINDLFIGGNGSVTKEEAVKQASFGQPLALKVGKGKGIIYLVYHSDGSYAGKRLAEYGGTRNVGIWGKKKIVAGIKFIIIDEIDFVD